MKFRNRIPENILLENPNADKFVTVLDKLNEFKELEVLKHSRFYRSVLLTDYKFLKKRIENYGYPPIPGDFPISVLYNMILNADAVMSLKGTKLGLEYWLWVMTEGEVTVDDSAFYPQGEHIILSDLVDGYVSHFDPLETPDLFLFSDISDFGTQVLTIDIETPHSAITSLENYINDNIKDFISFVSDSATITINFTSGPYVPYAKPYQYFVIQ